ncbi:hypothetical protein K435DRAFT_783544 [Dendrothele bispora CBS 962.96]|uniref:Uncharacterized protein n=1 Tax=Dendrothele bispora (strain CBS 962.96) TaxID=1314807 RepID=A0A4V4HCX1_DENBC|nr:hypothetical protein K435DRAFT_783544 [Dendrothele bispora CBS 962.96]
MFKTAILQAIKEFQDTIITHPDATTFPVSFDYFPFPRCYFLVHLYSACYHSQTLMGPVE